MRPWLPFSDIKSECNSPDILGSRNTSEYPEPRGTEEKNCGPTGEDLQTCSPAPPQHSRKSNGLSGGLDLFVARRV